LQSLLAAVAGFGFLLTFIGHVGLIFGYDFYGKGWPILFVGIFVVWFPTVLSMRKLGPAFQKKDGWKIALIGAPPFAKHVFYGTFGYAIVNFAAGVLGAFEMKGSGFWRVGSSHAMAFYGAAWALALAAAGRASLGIEWKCERGHQMTPGANFCEECGARAIHQEVS
jgi:hypothetical protein